MQYRTYGKGGPLVSVLGYGAMRLPTRGKDAWGRPNFSRATQVIRRALQAGVNFIDSHHDYHRGFSEEAVGRALKGWRGQRVYVQTKTPFYRPEKQDYFKRLLEAALEKLGVDCIDYLLFHSMRMEAFKRRHKGFFRFTDWAIKRGLIPATAASAHTMPPRTSGPSSTPASSR